MIAFLFPGQGSQQVGMGEDICRQHRCARSVYERVSEITGVDVAAMSFQGPASVLKESRNAQVSILATSLATFAVLSERGVQPAYCAGHSLGEYSALIAAGALSMEEGGRLVQRRGMLMSECCVSTPGTMAAITGLDLDSVERLCSEVEGAYLANYNTASQFVISGVPDSVRRVADLARSKGGKATDLPVSGAFHTPLMKEASAAFADSVNGATIHRPSCPVIGNVNAAMLVEPEDIRSELMAHMLSPVRWLQTVKELLSLGVTRFVEIGPGNVLKGLVMRIDRRAEVFSTGDLRGLHSAVGRCCP